MAASELQFTKSWTSSEDFPTYEPNETQVRADMQLLFDEIKNHINTVLLPDLLKRVPDTRKVNGHALTGDVTVTKGDVGLGSADNTRDADKPVSTAQQAALDQKADKSNVLEKDNAEFYMPSDLFHPATKSYVDSTLAGAVLGQVPDGSIGRVKLTAEVNEDIDRKADQENVYSKVETVEPGTFAKFGLSADSVPDQLLQKVRSVTPYTGVTGGNGSALTLSAPGFSLYDGAESRFKLHVDSGATPTINVNGIGAKKLMTDKYRPMRAGVSAGTWVSAVYSSAFDFFVLRGSTDAGVSSFYNTKTGGSTLESLLGYTPIKVNLAYLKGWWV